MEKGQPTFNSLTPFLIFVSLFLYSTLCTHQSISSLFCAIIALSYAIVFPLTSRTGFNDRIALFIAGSAHPTAIATCYILLFSAIFTHIVNVIGGTHNAVHIGMHLLPTQFLLPGFFTVISLFATAIGSSMGAIAAFLPIGIGIGTQLHINPALISGIVVSGAMLGDNLSIISDTTLAATQATHCAMKDKFWANLWLVIPAFVCTIIVLIWINSTIITATYVPTTGHIQLQQLITIIPYLVLFVLAPFNIDVIFLLIIGIATAIVIGITQQHFTLSESSMIIFEGFSKNTSIQEVFLLVLFVAGIAHIVEHQGGIAYVCNKIAPHITTKSSAECAIALLVFLVNAVVAINTIAILLTGPVARHIALKAGIAKERVASLIDIVACICQGILPYAPQLLLAASLASISPTAIIPYLHYQWFILAVTVLSIGRTYYYQPAT